MYIFLHLERAETTSSNHDSKFRFSLMFILLTQQGSSHFPWNLTHLAVHFRCPLNTHAHMIDTEKLRSHEKDSYVSDFALWKQTNIKYNTFRVIRYIHIKCLWKYIKEKSNYQRQKTKPITLTTNNIANELERVFADLNINVYPKHLKNQLILSSRLNKEVI